MFSRVRNLAGALALGTAVVLTPTASAFAAIPSADLTVEQQQNGLVNVDISHITTGDILSKNNVAIGVAAQAVAAVCPNLSVGNVAVLAAQASRTNVPQTATCDLGAGQTAPVTITPAA